MPATACRKTLGPFLNALVARRKGMRGYVLGWDYAMLYALEREWWSILRFRLPSQLAFRLDDRHPLGASHHQKVIVVDDNVAFVSGFDLAPSRWDTTEHACQHPLRVNGVAGLRPLSRRGRDGRRAVAHARWRSFAASAGGARPEAPRDTAQTTASPWPSAIAADIEQVDVAIARTEPPYANRPAVGELRQLHLDAIAGARRFIFAENQYFTSTIDRRRAGRDGCRRPTRPTSRS